MQCKHIIGIGLAAILAGSAYAGPSSPKTNAKPIAVPNVGYTMLKIGKAKYHAVVADMSTGGFSLETVHRPRLTSIWELIKPQQPIAAITGTFFNPATHCPVADVLVDGRLVAKGSRGTAVGVSYFGDIKFFDRPFGSTIDWAEYRFGLRGAVRLISDGKVVPDPKSQRFRDRRIWGRAARAAVGMTERNKLVFVATNSSVTLRELGDAMRRLNVVEAVNLDGGGSTALYYKGSLIVPPKRKLSNLFVLKSGSYDAYHPAP